MSDKRTSLEKIAPTVEEAVANGLADLGLTEEAVEVEILDEGSKGLFGLGSRQARVRLTIKSGVMPAAEPGAQAPPPATADEQAPVTDELAEEALDTEFGEGADMVLDVARQTVEELLERMNVYAGVTACLGEPDDSRSRVPVLVDIHGDDLSILIGPKAETLNAFQYIVSLIVGKELGRSIPLVLDVEGYRVRRAQQLRQLANKMADQVVNSGRRQSLEPMPASERRLVHIALRQHPGVYTESTGEDPRRKVMIIPKE
ncbi:RNA-binding cell elongation regulator Jag/EloR [Chloroflexota bacterium]